MHKAELPAQSPVSKKIFILLVAGAAILMLFGWIKYLRSSGVVEPVKNAVAQTLIRPEDRAWNLCWRMPPSAKSSLGIREKCSPAKIVRLDEAYFTIVASYEHQWQKHQAVLNWEKAKDEKGYWSQPTPKLSGTWALIRISPDLYNGWYRDSKGGEEGVMWLQAH